MALGRLLILAGLVLFGLGGLILLAAKLNLPVGRLPGDIVWRGNRTTVYVPIATCLCISVLLSLLFWLVGRR